MDIRNEQGPVYGYFFRCGVAFGVLGGIPIGMLVALILRVL